MLAGGLGRDPYSLDQLFAVPSPQKASQPSSGSTDEQRSVMELPSLPGSAELFLSAMLSVGVWQAVRKTRHVHFADLPDWYHADGPAQIGHSVAIDLQFAPLAPCAFDEPVKGLFPSVDSHVLWDVLCHCESQHFLAVEAPRGPPSLSS